jgi:hypothetical protein
MGADCSAPFFAPRFDQSWRSMEEAEKAKAGRNPAFLLFDPERRAQLAFFSLAWALNGAAEVDDGPEGCCCC